MSDINPRVQQLVDWIKEQRELTAENLNRHMRDIHEQHSLYKQEKSDAQKQIPTTASR